MATSSISSFVCRYHNFALNINSHSFTSVGRDGTLMCLDYIAGKDKVFNLLPNATSPIDPPAHGDPICSPKPESPFSQPPAQFIDDHHNNSGKTDRWGFTTATPTANRFRFGRLIGFLYLFALYVFVQWSVGPLVRRLAGRNGLTV